MSYLGASSVNIYGPDSWKVTPFADGPSFYISKRPNWFRMFLWWVLGVKWERTLHSEKQR